MLAATVSDGANLWYLLVGITVGVISIAAAAILLIKAIRAQGVRDAAIDKLVGDKDHPGVMERLDRQDAAIAAIRKEVTPNGGKSAQLGDTAKRTEAAVEKLSITLAEHIGESRETHRSMWRSIGGKSDK